MLVIIIVIDDSVWGFERSFLRLLVELHLSQEIGFFLVSNVAASIMEELVFRILKIAWVRERASLPADFEAMISELN